MRIEVKLTWSGDLTFFTGVQMRQKLRIGSVMVIIHVRIVSMRSIGLTERDLAVFQIWR
jgi:hypothetical protein